MRSIQIVCDSTAGFTREEIEAMNLIVVPLSIQLNGEFMEESTPDAYGDVYEKISLSKTPVTTSQPSASRFQEVFENALSLGRDVVGVFFSAAMSGTCGAAEVAAAQTDAGRVTIVDSQTGIANLKSLVTTAWQSAQQGLSAVQIKERVEQCRQRMSIVFTVGDLLYLRRGGRLSNSQYFVGKLLNILPLLVVREGKITPQAKIRGEKAMMSALLKSAPQNTTCITMLHINNEPASEALRAQLLQRFPGLTIGIAAISPVMGVHLGPGSFGYAFEW